MSAGGNTGSWLGRHLSAPRKKSLYCQHAQQQCTAKDGPWPLVGKHVGLTVCRVWDMRPYAPANRCTKVLTGHLHNFEKLLLKCDWSPKGDRVSSFRYAVLEHFR